MPLSQSYFSQYNDARTVLNQIAEKFPENKEWKPQEDMNPLGKIARHVVLAVYHILTNYAKVETPHPPKDLMNNEIWNKEDFKRGLKITNDLVVNYFKSINDVDLPKEAYQWTFGDGRVVSYPISWVVNQLKVHEVWHAAQLKLYLKLMGVDTSKIKGM